MRCNPRTTRPEDFFVAKLTPDGTALVYATYLGGSDRDVASGYRSRFRGRCVCQCDHFLVRLSHGAGFAACEEGWRETPWSRNSVRTAPGSSTRRISEAAAMKSSTALPWISRARHISQGGPTRLTSRRSMPSSRGPAVHRCVRGEARTRWKRSAVFDLSRGHRVDGAIDIAVDSLGAAYVVGNTTSPDFPSVNPLPAPGGGCDAFVSKLAPDGTRLIYSTRLGGTGFEVGYGIAIDVSGAAYVTGQTDSTDFPTMNALQPQLGAVRCGRIRGEDRARGRRDDLWDLSGRVGRDRGSGIAVDTAGAAHVTGPTGSTDFPTMNPLQPASGGSRDAFVSKLSPDGAALVYSTYLGGEQMTASAPNLVHLSVIASRMGITVDLTGATYVTGHTQSQRFPDDDFAASAVRRRR